jgi:hypothetical protein
MTLEELNELLQFAEQPTESFRRLKEVILNNFNGGGSIQKDGTNAVGFTAGQLLSSDGTKVVGIDPADLEVSTATQTALNLKSEKYNELLNQHKFVTETTPRQANAIWTYAGTVRTCGIGGTHATITAAYNACVSGDIIQLLDGEFNLASESGGYLLLNTASKNVLIRGNSANNGAVIIRQSAAASFGIRFRNTGNIKFQDLTITTNQSTAPIFLGFLNGGVNAVFDNCILNTTSSAYSRVIVMEGTANANSYVEFKNCDISRGSHNDSYCIWTEYVSDANSLAFDVKAIVSNCNLYGGLRVLDSMKFYLYDSNIIDATYGVILQVGSDTSAPTYTNSIVDVRGCNFKYRAGFGGHSILMGRGTKFFKLINNKIYTSPSTSTLDLGIVIKSTATTLGDVLVEGNYIEAPRPLYIKGGINCSIKNNTSISNWNSLLQGYGIEINNPNNPDGAISSIGNEVVQNTLIGIYGGIGLTEAVGAVSAISSVKQCIFRGNKYQLPTGVYYMTNPDTLWENRKDVWKQDVNSILYTI